MRQIDLSVSRSVLRTIQKEARLAYPKECFVVLLGIRSDDGFTVDISDTWIPPDLKKYSHKRWVICAEHWVAQANEKAIEEGLSVCGAVHSHPYTFEETNGKFRDCSDPAPSSGDWQGGWSNICGITSIIKIADNKFRTRTKFYGPSIATKRKKCQN